jgi:hypothetical protein
MPRELPFCSLLFAAFYHRAEPRHLRRCTTSSIADAMTSSVLLGSGTGAGNPVIAPIELL